MKRIAAIDIGSNAIRDSVAQINEDWAYEILYKNRVPLRLGREAFKEGYFSEYTINLAVSALEGIRKELDTYNIDMIRAVATSALRAGNNRKELCKRVFDKTGIVIHTIDGFHEAKLIYKAVKKAVDLQHGRNLIMDLGGGSLELTSVINGNFIECHTFKLGTIRLLNLSEPNYLAQKQASILKFLQNSFGRDLSEIKLVGTGGNARRMGKLRKRFLNGDHNLHILREEMQHLHDQMKDLTPTGRVKSFSLSIDRADVIVPAFKVFLMMSDLVQTKEILLPKVGLIHGIFEDIMQTELDHL